MPSRRCSLSFRLGGVFGGHGRRRTGRHDACDPNHASMSGFFYLRLGKGGVIVSQKPTTQGESPPRDSASMDSLAPDEQAVDPAPDAATPDPVDEQNLPSWSPDSNDPAESPGRTGDTSPGERD